LGSDRPGIAHADRWPAVDHIVVLGPTAIDVGDVGCNAVMIMSHNFEHDLQYVEAWLATDVPYIGLLGPRQRKEQILDTLAARGVALDGAARKRIRAPVGLDLGAETAEEIALAIVAEIQAVHAGRPSGVLADRAGPIHVGP
jgi:xanthine/CO dehydrogenase XdhC/CoxF family maturation factor